MEPATIHRPAGSFIIRPVLSPDGKLKIWMRVAACH